MRGATILRSYTAQIMVDVPKVPHEPRCLVRIRTPQNSAFLSPNHTPSAGRAPAGQSSNLDYTRGWSLSEEFLLTLYTMIQNR